MATPRRARARPVDQPAPGIDWLIVAVATAGVLVSAYLTWTKWSGGSALFCERGSACDVIQASRYARFLGVPTAAWGVGLYAIVIALAAAGLTAGRWMAAFALAAAGCGFSVYLTYLALWELRAACPWCLADFAVVVALLAALVRRRPTAAGWRPMRPPRLAATGAVAAVAAMVFAAGVFVVDTPTGASIYQEGLARHLAASGVIFYGAFW